MLRVAICDHDPPALGQLRSLVEQNPDVELVGGFAGGRAFLDAVATGRPDLVLLDLEMPGLDGFETVEALADMNGTALTQPRRWSSLSLRILISGSWHSTAGRLAS
jgi:DNA-binding NarL/FixJ family response regulator